ncbi:MAG: cytochrome c oxidase subunit II [Calditrichaeota bacterium]|nr:MAG: cytochrome c oxidase subunit II [Calditrichota bacterium]
MKEFHFFPERASNFAGQIDLLFWVLVALSVFFALLIFVMVFIFAVGYRRKSADEIPKQIPGMLTLELAWSIIPLGLALFVFGWGAKVFFDIFTPPAHDALEIFVVGKQWMWHLQHPNGKREINELHLPVGQPIKLTMASEDVIHSFFIPAFRVKMDVVPGRYTSLWFTPTKVGEYHLFCAEYCGTGHSRMVGRVVVMDPGEYEKWLGGAVSEKPLTTIGEEKFLQLGCISCHSGKKGARGPDLRGMFGKTVKLQNGQTVVFDEAYIRESILTPKAKVVAGFRPVMPTFQGLITETDILALVAYIKSLTVEESKKP